MGDVYPIGQTCQYMIDRAARHRRAGRYDQSMLLLSRARNQFGSSELLEYESARTYDEMGCEDEACRHYLRVVLADGKYKPQALFHLALTAVQQADICRAVSYFEAFCASSREGISPDSAELLQKQLVHAVKQPVHASRRQRARALELRAVRLLHAGKLHASRRTVEHALRLHQSASAYALKACCHLLHGDGASAQDAAEKALRIRPGYIQARCILVDAYMLNGKQKLAKETLIHAAACARSSDTILNIAIECAKYGYDKLTLVLTKRLIKRDPYHIRALAMRACALTNTRCLKTAKKLFGRLCTLLPDNGVYCAYYQMLKAGGVPEERLTLAQEVTREIAVKRCLALISMIHEDPDELRGDPARLPEAVQLSDWALHSVLPGADVTTIAIIILNVLNTAQTRQVLMDALTDARLDDGLKQSILHAWIAYQHEVPIYADLDGEFVRLAAGASMPAIDGSERCQDVVQQAAASLFRIYPDAPQVLLHVWTAYLQRYGPAKGGAKSACAAALEYAYHLGSGRCVDMHPIARKHNASSRLAMLYVRRMLRIKNSIHVNAEE